MVDKAVDLITDFRNGSEQAFRIIYDTHHAKIYRFAYSFLKDKDQSQEVLQETFINFWVSREKFDSNKAIAPYLFTICKRLVLDNFRKATSSSAMRAQLLQKISEIHNTTEEGIIFADLMNFAEKAIAELPRQQQLIFRLSRFEGLSYDEIAERLDLSKNTVKNHLVVALKTLKSQFGNQEMIYVFLLYIIS
jgi:RNA polymerase sigma-70 factor (family 1)